MAPSIRDLKSKISPLTYYSSTIGLNIGHHTGKGWHKTHITCPFHNDKKPGSFYINLTDGKFHCFSCGAHGDIISFHAHRNGMNIGQALADLGRLYR